MARVGKSRNSGPASCFSHDDVGNVVFADVQNCVNRSGQSDASVPEYCHPYSCRFGVSDGVCSSVAHSHVSLIKLGPVSKNKGHRWRFIRTSRPILEVMGN